jgi:hypothetical protein
MKAAKTTQRLIRSVQDSVGFDQVLASGSIEAGKNVSSSEPESTQSLLEMTVNAIRKRLASDKVLSHDGASLTRDLRLSTRGDGTVEVQSPPDYAAAIDASLSSDGLIRRLVSQLHARLGSTQIEVPRQNSTTADERASVVDLTH